MTMEERMGGNPMVLGPLIQWLMKRKIVLSYNLQRTASTTTQDDSANLSFNLVYYRPAKRRG